MNQDLALSQPAASGSFMTPEEALVLSQLHLCLSDSPPGWKDDPWESQTAGSVEAPPADEAATLGFDCLHHAAAVTHAADGLEILRVNPAFERLLGLSASVLVGQALLHQTSSESLQSLIQQALHLGRAQATIEVGLLGGNPALPVLATITRIETARAPALLLVFEDQRQQLRRQAEFFNAQALTNVGTWQLELDNLVLCPTPQACRIMGWQTGRTLSLHDLRMSVHADDRARFDLTWDHAQDIGHYRLQHRVQTGHSVRWVESCGRIERDEYQRPVRCYGSVHDITERKFAEHQLQRLAFYDPLTDLPNWTCGVIEVQQLLDAATRANRPATLVLLEMDRLKHVHDVHGHSVADEVLALQAARLLSACESGAVVSRFRGDQFVLAHIVENPLHALSLVGNVLDQVIQPIHVGRQKICLSMSAGLVMTPEFAGNASDLLQKASLAMEQSKQQGGNSMTLYEAALTERQNRRLTLGERLEHALNNERLTLHYQPKLDFRTGELIGAEALARWHDPEWGWISPGEFIPVAEQRGLILQLGDWALRQASRQIRHWMDAGVLACPRIAVNVSGVQMADDTFAERALAIVCRAGIGPESIELEITESALVEDPVRAERNAQSLVSAGFTLSIDDFGTGYSSLDRLRRFPISKLKIDQSFVRNMFDDSSSLTIVTAIIGMARALNLKTVAEGVETAPQMQALASLHCDEAQGFHISKAVPAEVFETFWILQPGPRSELLH
jgi:diguanylate cyclase (GGDEF)-like protein/PAS domain S-box-containing protein